MSQDSMLRKHIDGDPRPARHLPSSDTGAGIETANVDSPGAGVSEYEQTDYHLAYALRQHVPSPTTGTCVGMYCTVLLVQDRPSADLGYVNCNS